MRRAVAACVLSVWTVVVGLARDQGAPASIWDGVYSNEQATRGETAYQASCAGCHGQDLVSVDSETPSLTGVRFARDWTKKTVGERLQKLRTTMPPVDPASMDDQTKLDIIAYVLKFNGYPAGSAELRADSPALDALVIEPKKAQD